jgi:hypothetical protein
MKQAGKHKVVNVAMMIVTWGAFKQSDPFVLRKKSRYTLYITECVGDKSVPWYSPFVSGRSVVLRLSVGFPVLAVATEIRAKQIISHFIEMTFETAWLI